QSDQVRDEQGERDREQAVVGGDAERLDVQLVAACQPLVVGEADPLRRADDVVVGEGEVERGDHGAELEEDETEDGGKDEEPAPGRLPPPEPDHCWAGSPVSRIFWIVALSSGAISLNVFLPRR